jgi:hypothetical protein
MKNWPRRQEDGIREFHAIGEWASVAFWNIGLNQNITTGLLENQTTQFTSAGLSANVDIYNGLQNQNRLRRANLSILSAQYQLTKMKDDVSLNVANAFLQILFNKENIKVRKNCWPATKDSSVGRRSSSMRIDSQRRFARQ